MLSAAFRQNVIHECQLDRGPDDPKSKAGGVCLWMNSFDNHVSANSFKRAAWGVAINRIFRSPCGWNNVRNNVLEGITGYANGESETAAFFSSHDAIRATSDPLLADKDDCRGWFTVGNVFRAKRGHDAPAAAAYVHGAAFYAWAVEQRKKLLASPPLTDAAASVARNWRRLVWWSGFGVMGAH